MAENQEGGGAFVGLLWVERRGVSAKEEGAFQGRARSKLDIERKGEKKKGSIVRSWREGQAEKEKKREQRAGEFWEKFSGGRRT